MKPTPRHTADPQHNDHGLQSVVSENSEPKIAHRIVLIAPERTGSARLGGSPHILEHDFHGFSPSGARAIDVNESVPVCA